MDDTDTDTTLNRRKLLELFGAASAVGLAGCQGGDESGTSGTQQSEATNGTSGTQQSEATNGTSGTQQSEATNGELGERVPTIDIQYWTGTGGLTAFFEDSLPTIEKNWKNRLKLDIEIVGKDIATQFSETNNDQRTHDVAYWGYTTTPYRLDPNWPLTTLRIDTAGGDGLQNGPNYANCKYSVPALKQSSTANEKERQQLVNEAEAAMSKDFAMIVTSKRAVVGAARTDQLNLKSVGEFGIDNRNAFFNINTTPKEAGRKKVGSILVHRLRSLNPYLQTNPSARLLMNYTPLIVFDDTAQLSPWLAEDWSVEENGTVIRFNLKDARFHNDKPLTAEDVAWTYDFLKSSVGKLPGADIVTNVEFDSVKAVDESTVEFSFQQPSLSFLAAVASQVGIVNSQHWQDKGAEDNPANFDPDPGYQSGPFKIDNFQKGKVQNMSTWEGHPMAPDPNQIGGIILQGFRDNTAKTQALRQGQVDWITDLGFGIGGQLQQENNIRVATGLKGLPYHLNPQYPSPPTKFKAFRHALGASINRNEIDDVANPVEDQEPVFFARMLQSNHPWGPPKSVYTPYTDNAKGEKKGARQILRNAGWGWDDNDNLRYPADADLSPRWPKGEEPSASNFPCLDMFE